MNRGTQWFRVVFGAVLSVALMVVPAAALAVGPQKVRGSDARPIRRADGHVDTPATITRLQQMHANTHMFGVTGQRDWDDLNLDFAPKAQAAGIKVWVNLWPPSECSDPGCADYPPYHNRYEDWACAIARLSSKYPVVTGWAIDDFANSNKKFNNLSLFTPAYVRRIRALSRSIQPTLEFYPVVYYDRITAPFVDSYGPLMDALIMPYRDDPYRNTLWAESLGAQLSSVATLLARRDRKLILMVYALNLSNTQVAPDVDYVRRITNVGMQYTRAGTIGGVVQYGIPLTSDRAVRGDMNLSRGTGNGVLVLTVDGDQETSSGDWAGASSRVRLNTGSTSCSLRVWHRDNVGTRPTDRTGYHFKQVVVDGRVMWERDVFSDDSEWHSTSMDLTPLLIGGSAELTLRLYEKAGVPNLHRSAASVRDHRDVLASFDDVTLTGCALVGGDTSFESTDGWRYTRRDGRVLAGQHIYDPKYSTTVFNTVAQAYAE
jgi:hypothetical protein